MGDWEDDDWEAAAPSFKPAAAVVATAPAETETKGAAILAKVNEPDMAKFADEDQGEPEEPKHVVVQSQPKKKEEKKWMKAEVEEDKPLDDPVAEKLRRQRLVEQADLAAAKELFGDTPGINLDLYLPKSVKDFEEYAAAIVNKYIVGHKDSKNYKVLIKSVAKLACQSMTSADIKEVEACVSLLKLEKAKEEQAAKQKAAPKKSLKGGGNKGASLSAGLDDYIYEDAGDGDDDFM